MALVTGDVIDIPTRSAFHSQLIEIHSVSIAISGLGSLLCAFLVV
jgi:hypothetical protein